jgi:hypothetical protein
VLDPATILLDLSRHVVARRSDVATSSGGGATQRRSLSKRHPDGAPVVVEEDAAAVTKLLFVRLIAKGRKVIVCTLKREVVA